MFDYSGHECKACGKKFTADDDIVVCPDCGTPYHRDCWKANGKCINTELHEKHMSWKEAAEELQGDIRCHVCGNDLRLDQLFCDNCGTPTEAYLKKNGIERTEVKFGNNAQGTASYSDLYGDPSDKTTADLNPFMVNFTDPLCGFNPDEEYEDGVKLREIGTFVGKNTHYYLPKFRFMKTTNFKPSMNIAALFFPEFYLAYRKIPLAAFLVMIVRSAISLPALTLSMQSVFSQKGYMEMFVQTFPQLAEMAKNIAELNLNTASFNTLYYAASLINCILTIALGSLANYWYYRHTLNRVSKIKKETPDNVLCAQRIHDSGGTSGVMLAVFIVLSIILKYVCMGLVLYLM